MAARGREERNFTNMKIISITIHEKQKQYPIFIGSDIIRETSQKIDFSKYSQIAIVTDSNIVPWTSQIKNILPIKPVEIILNPGETEKSIDSLQTIWEKMIESKFDRKSLLINLGGGVIGDMGGFAAATYMRGIDFIQIPTTLLSMVDASVGGKLAIDFQGYKNIIGSFVQPKAVIIDVNFLSTLPDREFMAGFAEIIKHGLIADKKYFEYVTSKKPKAFSKEEMIQIIKRSCEIKANVVQKDEQEAGLRKILNFGHTIGHAIESLSLKNSPPFEGGGDPKGGAVINPLLHGEAIAIGMIAEAKLSLLIGNIDNDDFELIKKSLKHADLPTSYSGVTLGEVLKMMKYDKKNEKGIFKWTLLKQIGEAIFDIEVSDDYIQQAVKTIIS